jgi:hypothetical protein
MKNMKTKSVLMLTVLTAVALVFAACSSSDDLIVQQTEQENETGTVKAEFTISLPKKVGTTRMSAATVQFQGEAFRGIRDIELYPFASTVSDVSATSTIPSKITLLAGTSAGKTGASSTNANEIINGSLFTTNNSHLYQNVDIRLGTQSFMFYGEAPTTAAGVTSDGALNKTVEVGDNTLGAISFNLQQICPNSALGNNATAIATYITNIANATGWEASDVVALRSLWESFILMRAGSWASIKAAVQQLYTSLASNTDAVSTAIKAAINNDTYVTSIDATTHKITFKEMGNYPADIFLPDGAAYLNWQLKENSTTEYEFVELADNNQTGLDIAAVTSYVYPASLRYYVLSDIVTSDQSLASLYADGKEWKKDIIEAKDNQNNLLYNKTKVESTTRSIAIKDQIQYAVGRLDLTVKADGATLLDNKNNAITVGTTNFPLTGILIGGQKAVDYKFQPIASATSYTIYDQVMATPINLTTTASASTYTLVLETPEATAANQVNAVVKIALEFENQSAGNIIGNNGQIIYPGTKFYVVGILDPYLNDSQKYKGTDDLIKKAFVQDYYTTANIMVKSFKNAYNVLPDLTLPSLEMGLSIDLDWNQGISQNINID